MFPQHGFRNLVSKASFAKHSSPTIRVNRSLVAETDLYPFACVLTGFCRLLLCSQAVLRCVSRRPSVTASCFALLCLERSHRIQGRECLERSTRSLAHYSGSSDTVSDVAHACVRTRLRHRSNAISLYFFFGSYTFFSTCLNVVSHGVLPPPARFSDFVPFNLVIAPSHCVCR